MNFGQDFLPGYFDKVDFGEYSSKRFYNWYDLMILEENRKRRVELYGSDYESDY